MKTKKEVKKLSLIKSSISKLNETNLQKIKGGKADSVYEDNIIFLAEANAASVFEELFIA